MITEGNKTRVEKAGLDDEIRDGYEYEMTVALEIINDKHLTRASKDRTHLFVNKPEFIITTETGTIIRDWCNLGATSLDEESGGDDKKKEVIQRVETCKTIGELISLYKLYPNYQQSLLHQFAAKKKSLEAKNIINTQNFSSNGTSNYK